MKLIESFKGWKLIQESKVNENVQAAKAYMQKMEAARLRKDPRDLTPEEKDRALTNRDYLKVLDVVKANPGYAYAFVKFHFDQKVPISQLKQFIDELPRKKHIIQQLPQAVDYYANLEVQDGGIKGFEAMNDAIRTIERAKEAKWIVDKLPKPLRDQYRSSSPDKQAILINAAHSLTELGPEIISRLFQKIASMSNWSIDDVIEYISSYLKGYSNLGMKQKIAEIEALEPEAGIIYQDEQYLVLSARTENSQKRLCSVANWCINRGSFSSYATDAVQMNIFNFGIEPTDPNFLIGTTIRYTGKVRTTHDVNDKYIQKSDEPSENLRKLGYPEKLIRGVLAALPTEMLIKKVVYDLKLDKLEPDAVIINIIKQGYLIDPFQNQEALSVILEIVRTRIKSRLTRKQVTDLYTKFGVLSKFSATLLNELLPDLSPVEKKEIYDSTLSIFSEIKSIAEVDPGLMSPQLKNVLDQEQAVLAELGLSSDAVNEFRMAEPAVKPKPTTAPPKTRPQTRPGPIPTKQPFKQPEPAKADAEDVIKRLKALLNEEL